MPSDERAVFDAFLHSPTANVDHPRRLTSVSVVAIGEGGDLAIVAQLATENESAVCVPILTAYRSPSAFVENFRCAGVGNG